MPNRLKALLITLWIFILFWWIIVLAIFFTEYVLSIIWAILWVCAFVWIFANIRDDLEKSNPDVQQ